MNKLIFARAFWAGAIGSALLIGAYAINLLWIVQFTTVSTTFPGDLRVKEVRIGLGGWHRHTSMSRGAGLDFEPYSVHVDLEALGDSLVLTVALLLLNVFVVVFSATKLVQSMRILARGNHATPAT
jgi:hypothetical protein